MTRKQHLQKLPLQKRLQAMEYTRRASGFYWINKEASISEAKSLLSGLFVFTETKEGHRYWWNIQQKYFGA